MEIVENTAIKLTVPSDSVNMITDYLEKSEVIADNGTHADVLVYWGLDEVQHLSKVYSYEIPSPIERDYDWPGMYTPFHHQRTTASFLSARNRAFCFNEAGTGKTSSVIWAADYLMRLGKVKKVLVICPLSKIGRAHV